MRFAAATATSAIGVLVVCAYGELSFSCFFDLTDGIRRFNGRLLHTFLSVNAKRFDCDSWFYDFLCDLHTRW